MSFVAPQVDVIHIRFRIRHFPVKMSVDESIAVWREGWRAEGRDLGFDLVHVVFGRFGIFVELALVDGDGCPILLPFEIDDDVGCGLVLWKEL